MQKNWTIDDTVLSLYREKESWSGSFYELSMAYKNEVFTEHTHLSILQWLWSDPSLLGVVQSRDQFGQPWQPIDPSSLAESVHSYGCIRFPHGQIVGCGSLSIMLEDLTWLILYIPLGIIVEHWEFRPIEDVTVAAFQNAADSITGWQWMGKF